MNKHASEWLPRLLAHKPSANTGTNSRSLGAGVPCRLDDLQNRTATLDNDTPEDPVLASVVITVRPVHRSSVINDKQIALAPPMRVDDLSPDGSADQPVGKTRARWSENCLGQGFTHLGIDRLAEIDSGDFRADDGVKRSDRQLGHGVFLRLTSGR